MKSFLFVIACAALGCGSVTGTGSEETSAACSDGIDNDENGMTDCDDPACAGLFVCQPLTEDSLPACTDGVDNDEDGDTDCDDSGCAAFVACLPPTEDSVTLCSDGTDNDGDGETDCDDADCAGFPACLPQREDTATLCQDGEDNDADGKIDCADSECYLFAFCEVVHGFPLFDSWNEMWDGLPRGFATLAAAETACAEAGARLPTATELYRNNAVSGTGDLGSANDTEFLWTLLRDETATPVVVRISDGGVSTRAATASGPYRCVWPNSEGTNFDKDRCYGPPGSECWSYGVNNVDAADRAPLDYVAAAAECSFYEASLPVIGEIGDMIHLGLPGGSNQWVWSGSAMYWYNGNYGVALARWTDASAPSWGYSSADGLGAIATTNTSRRFRCVGLATESGVTAPASSNCLGGCFTTAARRSVLVADSADRAASSFSNALETCRALGGDLPNQADFADLNHAGWPDGTNQWLWLSDPMYWYPGNYGHALGRFAGTGAPSWSYRSGLGGVSDASSSREFRCVWRSTLTDLPSCAQGEVYRWTDSSLTCAAAAPGTSSGGANPSGVEIVDRFGNAWDTIERPAATWADASMTCTNLGGRLPTANEIYGARANEPAGPAIGDTNDISLLWTGTASYGGPTRIRVRVSDGVATRSSETTAAAFRCIWPAGRGDVLSGKGCYGPAGAECFRPSPQHIADNYDRVAVDAVAASHECLAVGGHLTDLREFAELNHAGWGNGSNAFLWLAESMYWYSGGYGYAIGRWLNAGTTAWSFINSTFGALASYEEVRPFRCTFGTRLR